MRRWISEYRWFFIAFLAFGVVVIKQVYRIGGTFDIMHEDEARYIETALSGNWPLDGVFYYAYLRVLSWFIADPLDLYQANFSVLIVLTGVSVFILSSVMLRSALLAFFLSSVFVASQMIATIWPFITLFAASFLVLLVAAFFLPFQNRLRTLQVALAGSILLMFIRPEFVVSVIVFLILGGAAFLWQWRKEGQVDFTLLLILILAIAILIFLNPAAGGRSMVAFCQHYALGLFNVGAWGESPMVTCDVLMKRDFPEAHSVFSAFVVHPLAFIGHVLRNLQFLFSWELWATFRPIYSHPWGNPVGMALVAFFLVSVLAFLYEIVRSAMERRIQTVNLLIIGMLIPVILSVLLIHPRVHYIVLAVPLLWIAGLQTRIFQTVRLRMAGIPDRWRVTVFAAVLVIVTYAVPWRATARTGFRIPGKVWNMHGQNLCTLKDRILFLRNLNLAKKEVRFLNGMGYLRPFLPANWIEYLPYEKSEGFDSYLKRNEIDAIWISPDLRDDVRYKNDPEFLRFEARAGWMAFYPPGCKDQYLLVRKDLIDSAHKN